jgi:subtilisin family serine protease
VNATEQAAILASVNAVETDSIPVLRMHAVDLLADTYLADAATLQANSAVVRVEPDKIRTAEATPSDPSYSSQWSLPQIGWDQAYGTVLPGGHATVAILDTGVDASHPDLAGKVVPGSSQFDASQGLTDPNGHGTWLAGIMAAATDNGAGIAGVAYAGVSVMPVTVLGADGTGQDSDIIEGVVYAADHGADVILMAFSNYGYSASLQAAIDYAWSNDVVLVAATGNDGSSVASFPAGDRGVIGVSATDQTDALWAGSNYGADVFMAAPGVSIETTSAGGGYGSITGTSAAAAEVAAAAALAKAVDPSASNGVIVGRLARNADPVGTTEQTGNGRLNLARALADTTTDAVVPAGAPGGGPLVGPYVAAANATVSGTVKSSAVGNPGISGATVACTSGCSETTTTDGTGNYSFSGGNKINFSTSPQSVTLRASKSGRGSAAKRAEQHMGGSI